MPLPTVFPPPFDRIDPLSCALGAAVCVLITAILLLLLHAKNQRRHLTLALRLDRLQDEARDLDEELAQLQQEYDQLLGECRQLDTENASLATTCRSLQHQLQERELLHTQTREQISQDFRILATQVMTEKGEMLNQQHTSALDLLLRPFHEQLQAFKQRVDDIHERESRDRVSLLKEIEHLKHLNTQIGTDAANLTQALRGSNKLQGQWGEMILSRLLEASGLRNGREYALQVHHSTSDGNAYKPDVLVFLPENRTVVIDAKVSLKAFLDAHQAESDTDKALLIRQHVDSIKKQIHLLAAKQYHLLPEAGSLDFVLLFIPVEGAFQLAVDKEPDILATAMQKKVILASPSTLLAILRTIHHLWRQDAQNRNSLVIAKQAGNLYDKFVGFAEAFEEIGQRLNQTQQAWHTARNRLTTGQGNLVARAEALKELGVQASRDLPASLKNTSSESGEPS